MNNSSSRYDLLLSNESESLNLDFILPTENKKIVHGTIWNDNDTPETVKNAVVLLYEPGKNYYDSDPNDLKFINYVFPDSNGEFVAGPFDINSNIIIKIFSLDNNLSKLSNTNEK